MTSLAQLLRNEIDKLNVPEGDIRDLVTILGRMMVSPDRPGAMLVAISAWECLRPTLYELYVPKTPLQEQLEYERVRRSLSEHGHDVPAWDDLPDEQRYGPGNEG